MDSNHDKGLQRALCYHYTTGQTVWKVALGDRWRKAKVPSLRNLKLLNLKVELKEKEAAIARRLPGAHT